MDRIGFLGLGTMGLPMAVNMAKAGFQLTVWNRTPEKAGPVLEAGAVEADSPAALLEWADTAVMMLSGPEAVDDALAGLVDEGQGLLKGKVLVNMGTNPPAFSRQLDARLEKAGAVFVDAPVSGTQVQAMEGDFGISHPRHPSGPCVKCSNISPIRPTR